MNLLFVCTRNRLRSATAEEVFADRPGVDAVGAGTNADAVTPVTADLVAWADLVLVMEPVHRARLTRRFGPQLRGKQVVVLAIPDRYTYMQPELVALLERKVARFLPTL